MVVGFLFCCRRQVWENFRSFSIISVSVSMFVVSVFCSFFFLFLCTIVNSMSSVGDTTASFCFLVSSLVISSVALVKSSAFVGFCGLLLCFWSFLSSLGGLAYLRKVDDVIGCLA